MEVLSKRRLSTLIQCVSNGTIFYDLRRISNARLRFFHYCRFPRNNFCKHIFQHYIIHQLKYACNTKHAFLFCSICEGEGPSLRGEKYFLIGREKSDWLCDGACPRRGGWPRRSRSASCTRSGRPRAARRGAASSPAGRSSDQPPPPSPPPTRPSDSDTGIVPGKCLCCRKAVLRLLLPQGLS